MTAKEYRVSFWGDENILELEVMVAQPCDYTKTTVQFKRMNFMIHELYFIVVGFFFLCM